MLRSTFVELADFSSRLANDENQVIFGRRGTGKTHALVHLRQRTEDSGVTTVFVDLRTVGSAGGYYLSAEGGRAIGALHVIVDLLGELHHELFATSLRLMESQDVTQLVRGMDMLADAASALTIDGATTRQVGEESSEDNKNELNLHFGAQPHMSLGGTAASARSRSDVRSDQGTERPALNLAQVGRAIEAVVSALPNRALWLLIDEWSAVPLDIQPILADFIRRCLLPCRGVVVKIAAVQRRAQFWEPSATGYVGMELGSDIFAGLDLDAYLANGLKQTWPATGFYQQMLGRHINALLDDESQVDPGGYGIGRAFPAFVDAIYFSAGIPRDLLAISGLAASRSSGWGGIAYDDVAHAARQFFLQEKEAQARRSQRTRALSTALREFAETRGVRFLVDRDHSHGDLDLLDLLDQRIVHLLDSGVGPRGKYDVYAVDLGMIADVLSEDGELRDARNPWVNWDHVKASQKVAPLLVLRDGRIQWREAT